MFEEFWTAQTNLNGLLHLNIAGAKRVTNYGLSVIARHCPNLMELNISRCANVGDAGLRELGLYCPKLTSINISSCSSIEGKHIKHLTIVQVQSFNHTKHLT
jgi:hypothetical protein